MAYLEIGGTLIHPSDITSIEEKLVVAKVVTQLRNPNPKPKKGLFKKLLYSDTIEETVEVKFFALELKVKKGMQITTHIDNDTGAIRNNSHQLYDFYTVSDDKEFIPIIASASNKKEIELEIGNYYCYPGMLQYSDYLNTNVIIDTDVHSKNDFIAKYIENTFTSSTSTKHKSYSSTSSSKSAQKFICDVYFFTKKEGGRNVPIFTSYMPTFSFGTLKITGVITLPDEMECCNPGDRASVSVDFEKPIDVCLGDRFSIIDHGMEIGSGTITNISE